MSSLAHSFHVPVLGIGFSVDMPFKTAQYGISSVISLVNDNLVEKMREYYSKISGQTYIPISKAVEDHRALRITEYLNLMQTVVGKQIEDMRNSISVNTHEVKKYFSLLPDGSILKKRFLDFCSEKSDSVKKDILDFIKSSIVAGEICVNIMTKVDRDNYKDGVKLDKEYSDALVALRGFANSRGRAAIVFSAGFNRRLYSYLENFDCFYPREDGSLEKKIILKISDYRSALTQAKFLASKGIWISEYRVESGLNCSGHAFPIEGKSAGMILEELKNNRKELVDTLFPVYKEAVKTKKGVEIDTPHEIKYTYQGGVATAKEHAFLMKYYSLDSIGWGAAFMFVPEVTNIYETTLNKLINARYEDLYISGASPLGVPFNTLRENINEEKMYERYKNGDYGYNCILGYLSSNKEFTEKPICTASKQYMDLKIEALKNEGLTGIDLENAIKPLLIKYCLCADLSKTEITPYKVEKIDDGRDVKSVCSGKTAAFFNKKMSLEEMADHIYGRNDHLDHSTKRPSLFITELNITIDYLKKMISEKASLKDLTTYISNIMEGLDYYSERTNELAIEMTPDEMKSELMRIKSEVTVIQASIL